MESIINRQAADFTTASGTVFVRSTRHSEHWHIL